MTSKELKTTTGSTNPRRRVLWDIDLERDKQVEKWGKQHRVDGTDPDNKGMADVVRKECDMEEANGPLPGFTGGASWRTVLEEEMWEAFAEIDKAKLRKELVQVGAVVAAWIEDLDTH
jgi:hypothetical protein